MKNQLMLALSLATVAAVSAPLSAQGNGRNAVGVPPGQMPPAGMCRIWIDGVPPGRQPRATDCATAQVRVPVNGRVIYGTNARGRGKYDRNGNGTIYDRNGDGVIDNRDVNGSGTGCTWWNPNCNTSTNGGAVNSQWHRVGQDRYGNVLYERRNSDANGNVIVETARRDANGNMVIVNRNSVNSNRSGRDDGDNGNGKGHGQNKHDENH